MTDERDYGFIKGLGYQAVEGCSRADYFNQDDGTKGDALVNDGSALLITGATQPSM